MASMSGKKGPDPKWMAPERYDTDGKYIPESELRDSETEPEDMRGATVFRFPQIDLKIPHYDDEGMSKMVEIEAFFKSCDFPVQRIPVPIDYDPVRDRMGGSGRARWTRRQVPQETLLRTIKAMPGATEEELVEKLYHHPDEDWSTLKAKRTLSKLRTKLYALRQRNLVRQVRGSDGKFHISLQEDAYIQPELANFAAAAKVLQAFAESHGALQSWMGEEFFVDLFRKAAGASK